MVWEPVLLTDWSSPSTSALRRIADPRASQYWDKRRLISHSMGEHDRHSVVWDHLEVYTPGVTWKDRPPQPLYEGGPVVYVTDAAGAAVGRALGDMGATSARSEVLLPSVLGARHIEGEKRSAR